MKTIRFFAIAIFIGIGIISCREKEAKQDVIEDMNDALEPVDKEIKKLDPKKTEDSDDDMIQNEINRIQDSISNESQIN